SRPCCSGPASAASWKKPCPAQLPTWRRSRSGGGGEGGVNHRGTETRRKHGEEGEVSEHHALDAVFEHWRHEVEDEAALDLAELHVGQELRFVDGVDALDRLELQDQLVIHQHVNAIGTAEGDFLVPHGDRQL